MGVHPFVRSIEKQYARRKLLFENPLVLPEFAFKLIPAVQSLGPDSDQFYTWFVALDQMKQQIAAEDFDVALIGAGAYGLPLAAHVKSWRYTNVVWDYRTPLGYRAKGTVWPLYQPQLDPFRRRRASSRV